MREMIIEKYPNLDGEYPYLISAHIYNQKTNIPIIILKDLLHSNPPQKTL